VDERAKELDSLEFMHWFTDKVRSKWVSHYCGWGIKEGYCRCRKDRTSYHRYRIYSV